MWGVRTVCRGFINAFAMLGGSGGAKAAGVIMLLIGFCFESGMEKLDWDAVFCISADEASVMRRLADRGISNIEALQRVQAQLPQNEKKMRSDFVVPNTGTLKELEEALRQAVQETASRKG